MLSPAQHSRLLRVVESRRRLALSQSLIAEALGVSQEQLGRILGGKVQRASRLFEEVCLFVERMDHGVTAEAVRENEELISALKEGWNGSSAHANALAAVIRSTKALAPSGGRSAC